MTTHPRYDADAEPHAGGDAPSGTRGETPPRSGGRGRRTRRVVLVLALVLAGLVGLFYGAGGWYFSGRIASGGLDLTVSDGTPSYDLRITALPPGQVRLQATGGAPLALTQPSSYALQWPGGSGHVGPPTGSDGPPTRALTDVVGTPPTVGAPAALVRDWYLGDPRTSLGLGFSDVTVAGPLGPLPAWYVPAAGRTWVVMVHGKGGLRREFLRDLPVVHAAGLPALVVTYRNDAGNAQDPSGQFGYGATEWPDLQAAVDWATAHGAHDVVLYGNSMGGGIVAAFLQHSDRAHLVRGVVLDSAMLDFTATVDLAASTTDLPFVGLPVPSSLTWTAERIAGARFDIDWAALDYVSDPGRVKVPVLAIHGDADPTVPVSVSERLAAAHPDLVQLAVFPKAAHLESWNTDRVRFETLLIHLPGTGHHPVAVDPAVARSSY